jgi:thiamine-phosphate pyrophosphorylase
MKVNSQIHGLYAITPDMADTVLLLDKVEAALSGGASVIQYRNKMADEALKRIQAEALVDLSRRYGVPLIINDDVVLAIDVGAAGAHVGMADGSISDHRQRVGERLILGASCHNRFDLAEQACRDGASYLAFGRFFPSMTKPGDCFADLPLVKTAKVQFGIPIVAIGGITIDNARSLIEAGVDAVCVIAGLFDEPDIEKTAAQFVALFDDSQ